MCVSLPTLVNGAVVASEKPFTAGALELVPRTSDRIAVESRADADALSKELEATVPPDWPPQIVNDPESPDGRDWAIWYVIRKPTTDDGRGVLVGIAGVKRAGRRMQIGCAISKAHLGKGHGRELVAALGRWACDQPGVDEVFTHIPEEHAAAQRATAAAGFVAHGDGPTGFRRVRLTPKR